LRYLIADLAIRAAFRGPSGHRPSDTPGTRIRACDLHTPAPAFPAARDWRSLPGRAARNGLAGL